MNKGAECVKKQLFTHYFDI